MVSSLCVSLVVCFGAGGPSLGIEGATFTLDGVPTFMLGCSYYGGLGISDESGLVADLDDLRRHGFNWIRVWATWKPYDEDTSAVTPSGKPREPYMGRLKRLCALAGERGIVLDATVSRGEPPFPGTLEEHRAVIRCLAEQLKPYRNVYFDVANERDVRDRRYVSREEVSALVAEVKGIDPARLCTASCNLKPADTVRFVREGKVDFLAPHRARSADSPSRTARHCRELQKALRAAGCLVPVLYQEPFRRGYGNWQPTPEAFLLDLAQARDGGGAGWCFHNGGVRPSDTGRPRRSFDMRPAEGRLFEQLDGEETRFLTQLLKQAAPE